MMGLGTENKYGMPGGSGWAEALSRVSDHVAPFWELVGQGWKELPGWRFWTALFLIAYGLIVLAAWVNTR